MISEPVTGISFLPLSAGAGAGAKAELGLSLLYRIASSTASHLQRGGYLSELEKRDMLDSYASHLASSSLPQSISRDFLVFVANYQAEKRGIPRDGEVMRMQKILRRQLNDRVHYWSLGLLPDRSHSLYQQYPFVEEACRLLLCPAYCAGEDIVHVAALNPFSGMVTEQWIRHDAALSEIGEEPFIFNIMVDFPAWTALQSRHFASRESSIPQEA